jgi:hypothetical protein
MPRKSVSEKSIVVSAGAAAAVPARRKSAGSKRTARNVEVAETSEVVVVSEVPVAATSVEPSYDEIARLAYSYWEARGYTDGSQDEDWLRAEQALRVSR